MSAIVNKLNDDFARTKRKIIYAIPFLDETGPMRAPYQICKGFLDRNWSVEIDALEQPGNTNLDVVWGRVPVKKIGGINKKHKMINFMINFLRKRNDEIVISWVWYWHCFSLLLSKIIFKNPYVLVLDSYSHLSPWDNKGRFSKLKLELRYGLVLRHADAIIAESPLSFEYTQRSIRGPTILFVPICFWKKDLIDIESKWSNEGFYPKRELVIFFAGQITERKNIHHLIEAFNQLSGSFPDWRLEIRGPVTSPDYLASLKSLVSHCGLQHRIEFFPSLYGEDLYRRYRTTSIYCLPSRFEGIPTGILEAMYFGGAIVTTYSGHIEYQLDHGRCGLLFEPGNVNQLTERLLKLMSSKARRDHLIEKARARVLEHFVWEKYFDQIDSTLLDLIEI